MYVVCVCVVGAREDELLDRNPEGGTTTTATTTSRQYIGSKE